MGATCASSVTACGGDVVGTWSVSSPCLKVNGTNIDFSMAGLDPTHCKNVNVTGSVTVSGTWTANADGTYTDGTTTTGSATITLPSSCLFLSGTTTMCDHLNSGISALGLGDAVCGTATSGDGCTCTTTINQMGGVGFPVYEASTTGSYATSGSTITLDGTNAYGYCVAGSMMTWTPQTTLVTTTGTIVFQKTGSPTGTGGTTGTAGTSGSAGNNGTAGTGGSSAGTAGRGGTNGTAGTGGTSAGTAGRGGTNGTAGTGGGSAGRGGTTGTAGSSGGTTGTAGTTGTGGSGNRVDGPCDIYAAANVPCGAAYSMVRGLRKAYIGPLYQVRNMSSAMNTGSGGMLKDIPMLPDGFADTSVQDAFCSGTTCTVATLYDQSGNGNDLKSAPAGLSNGGTYAAMPDFESSATKGTIMISGHKVYTLYMNTREGYRTPLNVKAKGVPMGNTPQGIYELADGTHTGNACCWDFGSVSPDPTKYVTMNTLFFGTATFWDKGTGSGPWFMGDFEGGVWAGGSASGTGNTNNNNPSLKVPYAFGVLHTPVGKYALRMANLQTATDLTTAYDGNIPSGKTWGNAGGIVLGVGGDNSNNSAGTFYEGALTNGSPSNDTDLAVMKNLQAAGYGK
jgi:hypothetical protein